MSTVDELTLTLDVLTAALVLITGFYAWVTYRILKANEAVVAAMRDEQRLQNRPYVQMHPYVRPGTQLVYLSIKNVGRTPARKLKLSLDRAFHMFGDKAADLGALIIFKQGIESLAPTSELTYLLGIAPAFAQDELHELMPAVFTVTATYEVAGKQVSEQTPIDLRPLLYAQIPPHPLADEIEKLRKEVEKLRTSDARGNRSW